jgi:hypothetical protein
VLHVFYKFGYIVTCILQIWYSVTRVLQIRIHYSTNATNLDSVARMPQIWIMLHVCHIFGCIVRRILQIWIQYSTCTTNSGTVFHVCYKFGYSVTRILQIWIMFHVCHKFGCSVTRMPQIWIQCCTYTTNLNRVFHMYYKFL